MGASFRDFQFHGCYTANNREGGTREQEVAGGAASEIFDDLVAPLLKRVLKGNSGTIMTYGQMGTGKTRFMNGSTDAEGMVQIAAAAVFANPAAAAGPPALVYRLY